MKAELLHETLLAADQLRYSSASALWLQTLRIT